MTEKLTNAAKRALVYTHFVKWRPKGMHAKTFLQVCDATDFDSACFYKVKPEYLPQIETHPLFRAVQLLLDRGFTVRPRWSRAQSGNAKCVALWNTETDVEAHAYDNGYWSIGFGVERGNVTRPLARAEAA